MNYIIKSTYNLKNPFTFRKLHITLVWPIITHASYIWSLHHQNKIYQLEKIQHIALKILAKRSGTSFDKHSHSYSELARKFKLCTFKSFHDAQDLIFLYKLLNNEIDMPSLLAQIDFKIPGKRMRYNNLNFNIKILKVEPNKKSLVSKMCVLANMNSEWCDFAETSKNRFKTKVKEQVYKYWSFIVCYYR